MSQTNFVHIDTSKSFSTGVFSFVIGTELYPAIAQYFISNVWILSKNRTNFVSAFSNVLNCLIWLHLNPSDKDKSPSIAAIFSAYGIPPHFLKIIRLIPKGGFIIFFGGRMEIKFFDESKLKITDLHEHLSQLKIMLNYNRALFDEISEFYEIRSIKNELQHFFYFSKTSDQLLNFLELDSFVFSQPTMGVNPCKSLYLMGILCLRVEVCGESVMPYKFVFHGLYDGRFQNPDLNSFQTACIAGLLETDGVRDASETEAQALRNQKPPKKVLPTGPRQAGKVTSGLDRPFTTYQASGNAFYFYFKNKKIQVDISNLVDE